MGYDLKYLTDSRGAGAGCRWQGKSRPAHDQRQRYTDEWPSPFEKAPATVKPARTRTSPIRTATTTPRELRRAVFHPGVTVIVVAVDAAGPVLALMTFFNIKKVRRGLPPAGETRRCSRESRRSVLPGSPPAARRISDGRFIFSAGAASGRRPRRALLVRWQNAMVAQA
jgi:hypothetical protein